MDISKLSEKELRELNHKIVERLRFLQQSRAHKAMLDFNIGECVCFDADGLEVRGIISKFNKKTVTVVTPEGGRWNVSPGFLSRVSPAEMKDVTPNENVISIKALPNKAKSTPEKQISRNALCPCGSGKKYKRCCLNKSNKQLMN